MTYDSLSRASYTYTIFLCRSFHQNVRIRGSGIRPVAASTSSRCRLADVTDGGGAVAARIAGSQLSFVRQLHLHLLQHIEDTKRCILVIFQHAQKLGKFVLQGLKSKHLSDK